MEIKAQLDTDIIAAMKGREKEKLAVLRFLKSKIKSKEIDTRKDLTNDEVIQIITSSIKQLDDSMEQYQKAGRDELVKKDRAEKECLLGYLPVQLSEEEVRTALKGIIEEEGISGQKEFGKLMKGATAKLKGKADGRIINQIARELLA